MVRASVRVWIVWYVDAQMAVRIHTDNNTNLKSVYLTGLYLSGDWGFYHLTKWLTP